LNLSDTGSVSVIVAGVTTRVPRHLVMQVTARKPVVAGHHALKGFYKGLLVAAGVAVIACGDNSRCGGRLALAGMTSGVLVGGAWPPWQEVYVRVA
jgi:hypothetical protein